MVRFWLPSHNAAPPPRLKNRALRPIIQAPDAMYFSLCIIQVSVLRPLGVSGSTFRYTNWYLRERAIWLAVVIVVVVVVAARRA